MGFPPAGGGATHFVEPVAGESIGPSFVLGATTNLAPAVGAMLLCPFVLPDAATITSIGVTVDTIGAAGSVVRLGLYSSGSNGRPSALLLDAGTVATATSTGLTTITVSHAIPAGVVWGALVPQVAAAKFRGSTSAGSSLYSITDTAHENNLSAGNVQFVGPTGVTGALPDPIGTLTYTTAGANTIPLIYLSF